jgi:hypothetical protein
MSLHGYHLRISFNVCEQMFAEGSIACEQNTKIMTVAFGFGREMSLLVRCLMDETRSNSLQTDLSLNVLG